MGTLGDFPNREATVSDGGLMMIAFPGSQPTATWEPIGIDCPMSAIDTREMSRPPRSNWIVTLLESPT